MDHLFNCKAKCSTSAAKRLNSLFFVFVEHTRSSGSCLWSRTKNSFNRPSSVVHPLPPSDGRPSAQRLRARQRCLQRFKQCTTSFLLFFFFVFVGFSEIIGIGLGLAWRGSPYYIYILPYFVASLFLARPAGHSPHRLGALIYNSL